MFQPPGSIPFNPSQLFAALQGAWLEPKQGLIWQENTGITPTTTGGQTIGKIADQSGYGNNATQATAGNRPLLGRRYNLLQYSQDFANAYWTATKASVVNGNFPAPLGSASAQKLIEDNTSGEHYFAKSYLPGFSIGTSYTYSVYLKAGERTRCRVGNIYGLGTGGGVFAYIDLSAKSIISTGGGTSALSTVLQDAGNSWLRFSVTDVAYATEIDPSHFLVSSGTTINYTGDGTSGIYILGADLRLTADVGKDPAYQRITTASDYDYGQYPAAIFDTNDFLSLSLPAINVRRNLLTYSEQFDNAVWGSLNAVVSRSATSTKLIATSVNGVHFWQQNFISVGGSTAAHSFYAKAGEYTQVGFRESNTTGNWAVFDLASGVLLGSSGVTNASITPAGNGWYRCSCTQSGASTQGIAIHIMSSWSSGSPNSNPFTGDGTSGIYIRDAQLELGSVATDYQRVTDWTSEAFSSNGSVYFATPVGMSQLNNQSMGQTYTLPALSSDIYSWMVFPQRLNAAQESKLAVYMQQKAGIAGPDYFEQVDYGPELVTNGDFSNGTTGWSGWNTNAQIAVSNGQMTVTQPVGGNQVGVGNSVACSTVVGRAYQVSLNVISYSNSGVKIQIRIGSFNGAVDTTSFYLNDGTGTRTGIFVADKTATFVNVATNSNAGNTITFDNISVRELKDGVTGQLSDDAGDLIFTAQ